MKVCQISRDEALVLLQAYNEEPFHIRHGLTVEAVMGYIAEKLGYGAEKAYWEMCGLLHDVDYEKWPEAHCKKAPELLSAAGVGEDMIYSICSHAYGICSDVEPCEEMEKVLFACDELTGLIGASVLMRPSKSCKDMEIKSVRKKFKDKHFAAGCDRNIIKRGAEMLGWEMDTLYTYTLEGMKACEDKVNEEMKRLGLE